MYGLYRLRDEDMGMFETKGYRPRSWITEKLCLGKEVTWSTTKMGISLNDITIRHGYGYLLFTNECPHAHI